jgi:enterochelin esterase-like enzyme
VKAPRAKGVSSLLDMSLKSRYLGSRRGVHVYLPPSYRRRPNGRLPVLYLHDGQNVFSNTDSDSTFGWGSWELDRTADALARTGKMREIIMVAVDNSPKRMEEYNGRRSPGETSRTAFEDYESFLIEELKPQIGREYRTLSDAPNTGVMGSSMGGLCSLVLAWDHPEVFGSAACLSTAFAVWRSPKRNMLTAYHGPPKPIRIYIDSGTVDSSGGDDGYSNTRVAVSELRRIGWTSRNLRWFVDRKIVDQEELPNSGLSREKWAESQESQHNEFYWRRRAWRAFTFLFPPS